MSNKLFRVAQAQKENAKQTTKKFSDLERKILNLAGDSESAEPHVNLKYYSSNFECFSSRTSDEMKAFSEFIAKFRKSKWQDIFNSGGSVGQKTGFARTEIDKKKYPKDDPIIQSVSQDINLFELRVDGKIRVHGFRCHDAFFLVYLDRQHRIGDGKNR